MPRDSNGVMTLPASTWVQTGDTVLPVQHNSPFLDIENALTNSIDRDGRTVWTGNMQAGGNKITGLAAGTNPGDAATVSQLGPSLPAGLKAQFAGQVPPDGWLKRNGAVLKRATYAALFAAIGTAYNTGGEASDEFRLPDDRGLFERSWDDGAGIDTGRTFGSIQQDQNKSHTHTGTAQSAGGHTHSGTAASNGAHTHGALDQQAGTGTGWKFSGMSNSGGQATRSGAIVSAGAHTHSLTINSGGAHTHSLSIDSEGGSEVRVKNRASLAIIKY